MPDALVTSLALKVGLRACATARFEAWHAAIIEELCAAEGIIFAGVQLDQSREPRASLTHIEALVFALDERLVGHRDPVRPSWEQSAPPQISAVPDADGTSRLDLLIDLTGDYEPGASPAEPPIETWSFDFLLDSPSPQHFAIAASTERKGAFLVSLLQHRSGGVTRLASAVCDAKASASQNLRQAWHTATALLLRSLNLRVYGLTASGHQMAASDLDAPTQAGGREKAHHPALSAATHFYFLGHTGVSRTAVALGSAVAAKAKCLSPRFGLYVTRGSPLDFTPEHAKPLPALRTAYLADPFLFEDSGEIWVFAEAYDYDTSRGRIVCGRLRDGEVEGMQTILPDDTHKSYPFIFRHDGQIYLIPETLAHNRIEVWRAVSFPGKWELHAVAFEGLRAIDTTLTQVGGRWWLFTSIARAPLYDAMHELSLFEVDGPCLGHPVPHPSNPVRIDASGARNGGRVFTRGDRLFRSAQCSRFGTYAYGLQIMEVTRLDSEVYTERPVRFIRGSHHMDCIGDTIIFDLSRATPGYAPPRFGKPS